jgi:hypothetical protein
LKSRNKVIFWDFFKKKLWSFTFNQLENKNKKKIEINLSRLCSTVVFHKQKIFIKIINLPKFSAIRIITEYKSKNAFFHVINTALQAQPCFHYRCFF